MIDISVPLRPSMTVWPGSAGVSVRPALELAAGDDANVSVLSLDVHAGTHVDAPSHTLADGAPMESIGLERLVGPALVLDVGDARRIGPAELEGRVPPHTERLLLRTANGVTGEAWDDDFAALSLDGARWVAERGIGLLGVDGPSVQRFEDGPETHHVLLRSAVVLLEGLDLRRAEPGWHRLVCLPISLPGLEAAPVRAILEPLSTTESGPAAEKES